MPPALNEDSRIEILAPGSYRFSWLGQVGRTYFLQRSANLYEWEYVPQLWSGNGTRLAYPFTDLSAKTFLRLRFSDIATNDPLNADFDGDGISNQDELANGTSPLANLDADNDGLPDDWEWHYFGKFSETAIDDPDGDGISNGDEYSQGWRPSESAPIAPSNVRRTTQPDGSVNISWDDNSGNEDSFRVYRKNEDGSYTLLVEVPSNQTSVTLPPGSGL